MQGLQNALAFDIYLMYYSYGRMNNLSPLLFQYMRYRGRPQRSLPFTADAQNGTLGEEGLHTHPSAPLSHEEAPI